MRNLLSASILLLVTVSCQVESRFFQDRLHDSIEILPISVATGVGLYGGVRVTPFFGTGVGVAQTYRAGWSDGVMGEWEELSAGWLLASMRHGPRRPAAYQQASLSDLPVGDADPDTRAHGAGNFMFFIPFRFGDKSMFGHEETPAYRDIELLDIELNLFVGIGGLRLGLSPLQFGDWVVGWFGWDPAGDDELGSEAAGKPAPISAPVDSIESEGQGSGI
ncbi:MAG: hypothetical protein RL885_04665 [Planctomycetota bacterium]